MKKLWGLLGIPTRFRVSGFPKKSVEIPGLCVCACVVYACVHACVYACACARVCFSAAPSMRRASCHLHAAVPVAAAAYVTCGP